MRNLSVEGARPSIKVTAPPCGWDLNPCPLDLNTHRCHYVKRLLYLVVKPWARQEELMHGLH